MPIAGRQRHANLSGKRQLPGKQGASDDESPLEQSLSSTSEACLPGLSSLRERHSQASRGLDGIEGAFEQLTLTAARISSQASDSDRLEDGPSGSSASGLGLVEVSNGDR